MKESNQIKPINSRIREVRLVNDLKQGKLAELLSIRQSSLSDIENGRVNVSERVISDTCRELNVSEEWLRTGNGKMFSEISDEDELGTYLGKIGSGKHPEIEKIIKTYFRLPEDIQKAVDQFINILSESNE